MEAYTIIIMSLCGLAALIASLASPRMAIAGFALLGNYVACEASILLGTHGVLLKVIASCADILALWAICNSLRTRPNAAGMHLAGYAMTFSVMTHFVAHVAVYDHLAIIGYYIATNLAMAVAAIGIIWSSLIVAGFKHGVGIRLPRPFGFDASWRVDVGRAHKAWKA